MREHNPVQRAVLDAGRARGLAPETLATWLSVLNENALLGPDGHLAAHRVTEFLDAIAPNRGQLVRRGPTATGHDGHGRHTSTPVISDENTQPAAQWATRFGSRKPHQDDERQQQMRATVSTISPRAVQVGPRGHAEAGRRFGTPAEVRDDRNPIP